MLIRVPFSYLQSGWKHYELPAQTEEEARGILAQAQEDGSLHMFEVYEDVKDGECIDDIDEAEVISYG